MIATQVSRPIRSASASGPIGCAKPSFAIVSIASGSATPSISAYAASLMNGIRIRFETKPGKSFACAGTLPSSSASLVIAAAVSSEVWTARITSTSFSTGTGLKKCIPITRSGRPGDRGERGDRNRGRVRREHGAVRQQPVGAPEELLLHGRVLDHGLDQQVGGDEVVDRVDPRQHLVGVGAALLGQLLEALAHRREPALGRARSGVVERDAPARARRRPGRSRRPSGRHRRRERARSPWRREANVNAVVTVRLARPDDADEIGRIQVETWRAAYTGLMPDEAIASFDVEPNGSASGAKWLARTPRPGQRDIRRARTRTTWSASRPSAPSRDEAAEDEGELYAIYVLPSSWGTGAGRALIERAEESLRSSGFRRGAALGTGGERARRALLPRRRLGAGRPQGRRVPGRDRDRAALPQASVAARLADEEERPGAEHEEADDDPAPVDRRQRVVLDVRSARGSRTGRPARRGPDRQLVARRGSSSRPTPVADLEPRARRPPRSRASRPRRGCRCRPCRPARRGSDRSRCSPADACARAPCR